MSQGGVPYWVYKENEALQRISHEQETSQLYNKIGKLEEQIKKLTEENRLLKEKIQKLEGSQVLAG
jgi:regulator of replication initiation timing